MENYGAFVPQGENRRETAKMLVDLCDEYGLDQHSVQSARGGFNVTEEVADLLGGVSEEDVEGEKALQEAVSDPQTHQEPVNGAQPADAEDEAQGVSEDGQVDPNHHAEDAAVEESASTPDPEPAKTTGSKSRSRKASQ